MRQRRKDHQDRHRVALAIFGQQLIGVFERLNRHRDAGVFFVPWRGDRLCPPAGP